MNREQKIDKLGFLASGNPDAITLIPYSTDYDILIEDAMSTDKPEAIAVVNKGVDMINALSLLADLPYSLLYINSENYTFCVMFENKVE